MRPKTIAILGGLAFVAVLGAVLWMTSMSDGYSHREVGQPAAPSTSNAFAWSKEQIADVVSKAMTAQGHGHAIVVSDTLVIVPSGIMCNLEELRQLRAGLVRHDMDPARAFAVMRCSGGDELKLH